MTRFTPEHIANRQNQVRQIFIDHREVQKIELEMEACLLVGGKEGAANLTMLVAPSGCGKSTTVRFCQERIERNRANDGAARPILYSALPVPCSIKTTTRSLLRSLGDPLADRNATTTQNEARIVHQLKMQGVRLVVLDEFQHLLGSNAYAYQETTDWLKQLLDKAGAQVILVGLPSALHVIATHDQLQRRTARIIRMQPFAWDDGGQRSEDFRAFLHVFEQELPFEEKMGMGAFEFAARMFLASNGLVGTISQLAFVATRSSMLRESGPDCLTLADFADAYAGLPFKGQNPFDPRMSAIDIENLTPVVSRRAGTKKPKNKGMQPGDEA